MPIPDLPYGLVVRIPAFHAGGPGSIPGVGTHFLLLIHNDSLGAYPLLVIGVFQYGDSLPNTQKCQSRPISHSCKMGFDPQSSILRLDRRDARSIHVKILQLGSILKVDLMNMQT